MNSSHCLLAASLFAANLNATELLPSVDFQFKAICDAKAERTPTEQKIQSCLLYLIRESEGKLAVEGAPHLESRVECDHNGNVTVDLAVAPSEDLSASIAAIGGSIISQSDRFSSVRISVPPIGLRALAARADVKSIKRGFAARTHTGSVTSQGDQAHRTNVTRTDFGVTGAGVKVGVISDSADASANAISLGDLPAGFTVLPGRFGMGSGEGTAMSEIVYDLAPGAEIFFASAVGGKAAFAESILALRTAGCDIIVDDISYPNEWQFQDDEIGQAVNTVVDAGALYLSSSGNEGNLKNGNSTTWEGDFKDGGTDPLLPAGRVHDFGGQNYNSMTSANSDVVLQWSDEYNSSSNDYDVHVLSADGTSIVSSGTDTQDGDDEPIEFVNAKVGERIVIWKADAAAARYLRISCTGGPIQFQTEGQTIGHASTPKCICVASSDSNAPLPGPFNGDSSTEEASSDGPRRMFYNPDGTPITPGNFLAATDGGLVTQSPAITGADGGVTTLPAGSGLNPFFGTSAAAPHCAAIAALILSKDSSLTNTQLRAILEASCIDIEAPGHDVNSGNGILMPHRAFWIEKHFGSFLPTGNGAPLADPDSDKLANRLEYATGSDPNASSPSPISVFEASADEFQFNFQYNPNATGVTLIFESSSTLAADSWTKADADTDEFDSVNDGIETRVAGFDVNGTAKKFFRLKVTAP